MKSKLEVKINKIFKKEAEVMSEVSILSFLKVILFFNTNRSRKVEAHSDLANKHTHWDRLGEHKISAFGLK